MLQAVAGRASNSFQLYLKTDIHSADQRQRARRSVNALHAETAAKCAAGAGLSRLDGVSNDNSIMTSVGKYGHLQLCHELLHDVIAFGVNDQICLLVLGSLLQIDDDKLPTCRRR